MTAPADTPIRPEEAQFGFRYRAVLVRLRRQARQRARLVERTLSRRGYVALMLKSGRQSVEVWVTPAGLIRLGKIRRAR